MELAIVARRALAALRGKGLIVERAWAGRLPLRAGDDRASRSRCCGWTPRASRCSTAMARRAPAWPGPGRGRALAPHAAPARPEPLPEAFPPAGPLALALKQAAMAGRDGAGGGRVPPHRTSTAGPATAIWASACCAARKPCAPCPKAPGPIRRPRSKPMAGTLLAGPGRQLRPLLRDGPAARRPRLAAHADAAGLGRGLRPVRGVDRRARRREAR